MVDSPWDRHVVKRALLVNDSDSTVEESRMIDNR